MKTIRAATGEQGVILIALLWILMALTLIALSFAREGSVEVAVARNSRDLTQSYYVARAGVSVAVYQLLDRQFTPRVQGLELDETDPLELGEIAGTYGGGTYRVEVQDESGKININFISEEQLHALLDAVGIPKNEADVITDSVLDWRDVDNAHRINGAEDDYYGALPRPYKAKNGRLDTVEELLLVRGVTREYFYGYRERSPDNSLVYRYGLSRYLTVYSNSNRINVNHAEIPVLMSLPGMVPRTAELIYERRKTKPFQNLGEITQELAVMMGTNALPFLTTTRSNVFTLTAHGQMANSKVQRVIRAVVMIDMREANRYRVIYWNENVPNL